MSDDTLQPGKRRPRVSLASLLLMVTIVGLVCIVFAMGIAVSRERANVQRVQTELAKLREDTCQLEVEDSGRLYAISLPSWEDSWRWRVYVPPGGTRLHYAVADIPIYGPAESAYVDLTGPGELIVEARVTRSGPGSRWDLELVAGRRDGDFLVEEQELRVPIPDSSDRWLTGGPKTSIISGVAAVSRVQVAGEPGVVLLQSNYTYGQGESELPDTTDGLQIRLEPLKGDAEE